MPTTSANMSLVVPIASTGATGTGDTGPGYAQNISNDLLNIIDAHDHSTGKGVQITPGGLNINADLTINSHNLTSSRAIRFTSQASALNAVGDVSEVYVVNGNLYFNNANGTAIQLTTGSSIVTSNSNTTLSYQAVTTNWTVINTDTYILMNVTTSGGAISITLPAANSVSQGRWYIVADKSGQANTNNITINTAGSDKINGSASFVLNVPFGAIAFASDGNTNWLLLIDPPSAATASSLGLMQLTGDLGNVATAPRITSLAGVSGALSTIAASANLKQASGTTLTIATGATLSLLGGATGAVAAQVVVQASGAIVSTVPAGIITQSSGTIVSNVANSIVLAGGSSDYPLFSPQRSITYMRGCYEQFITGYASTVETGSFYTLGATSGSVPFGLLNSTNTNTHSMWFKLYPHNGATLYTVTLVFQTGTTWTAVPSAFPTLKVTRYSANGVSGTGGYAATDIGTTVKYQTETLSAWNNGYNKSLQFTTSIAYATVDTSQYEYIVQLTGSQAANTSDKNINEGNWTLAYNYGVSDMRFRG